jgi:hypothetical protein
LLFKGGTSRRAFPFQYTLYSTTAITYHSSNFLSQCFSFLILQVLDKYDVCSSGSVMITSGAFSRPHFYRQGSSSSTSSAYAYETSRQYPSPAMYGISPSAPMSRPYPSQTSSSYPRTHSRPASYTSSPQPHHHQVVYQQNYVSQQQAMYNSGARYPSPPNFTATGW